MKKIINLLIWTGLIAVSAAGIYWKLNSNKKVIDERAQAAQVRNTSVLVTTVKPEKRALGGDFSLIGTLRPARELAVMSEVGGRLTQVNFENGSSVRKGYVLAVVDNDLISRQLAIARINLEKAGRDTDRLAKLASTGGVPQQQLEDARNQVENLKSQVSILEKQLAMTQILAPFEGVITNKSVETGAFASPGMKLADLVQVSKVFMRVYATESQLTVLKTGQTVKVTMDLMPDKPISGRISFIDVKADPSQRYLVEIEMANPGNFRAGMNGTVTFTRPAAQPVMTVPRASIVGSVRDAHVYVIQGDKAVYRAVQAGAISNDYVEIKSGLTADEWVVLTGQINLSDGAQVTISK
jgi:membrane fusion protein (multidrug efflux system)